MGLILQMWDREEHGAISEKIFPKMWLCNEPRLFCIGGEFWRCTRCEKLTSKIWNIYQFYRIISKICSSQKTFVLSKIFGKNEMKIFFKLLFFMSKLLLTEKVVQNPIRLFFENIFLFFFLKAIFSQKSHFLTQTFDPSKI